jgi:large subunit ribosomal protein L17
MRHRKAGRKLGRNGTHRLALYRNLALALFRHERIITTEAKAKAVRPFIEKLITLARKGTLHSRRLVLARLGPPSKAEVHPPEKDDDPDTDDRTVITKLFSDIAPRYVNRPGGYTRIVKRHQRRLGDGGKTAYLELLKAGEVKVQKREAPPAPAAPRLTETSPPAPPPAATETPAPPATEPQSSEQVTPPAAAESPTP